MTYEYQEWWYGTQGVFWNGEAAQMAFEQLESDGWEVFLPTVHGLVLRRPVKTLCPECMGRGVLELKSVYDKNEVPFTYYASCRRCGGTCHV